VPRVLIVDDHRNTRETLAMGLALSGWTTDTASGAREARRLCVGRQYDAIVCDIRMPDGNGVEFVADLRETDGGVRLVLITAYEPTEREARIARTLGADLLIKPVTAEALATCCRQASASSGAYGRPAP
jgi:DNA-binding NtrC family response regulator